MQRKAPNDLGHLRAPVGNFDAALIHILAQKFHCTQAVGVLKACYMPAEDRTRERCQVAHLWQLALESHLDPDFTEKFLQLTTQEVIDNRKIIFEENKKISLNDKSKMTTGEKYGIENSFVPWWFKKTSLLSYRRCGCAESTRWAFS